MWTALLVTLGVIAAGAGGGLLFTQGERTEAKNLPIAAVDFTGLNDGTYVGEYEGGKYKWRRAKVEVIVSSEKVTDIKLLEGALDAKGQPSKLNAKGLSIKDLFDRIVQSQSLQVDTISGATLTSKAHLKAVEAALGLAQEDSQLYSN